MAQFKTKTNTSPQVVILQFNARTDSVDRLGRRYASPITFHRGMDKATVAACERPSPNMSKREWWAVKMARFQDRRRRRAA